MAMYRSALLVTLVTVHATLARAFNPTWFPSAGLSSCSDLHQKTEPLKNTAASYAASGQVGLGGGVEVVLAPAFCREMLRVMEFVDSCGKLLKVVGRAARLWSDFHPYLYFNISMGFPRLGEVVMSARRDPLNKKRIAAAKKIDENGRFEIEFNTEHCFIASLLVDDNLDSSAVDTTAKRCHDAEKMNFELTLAHELGHVLGIGHPGENGILLGPQGTQPPKLDQHIPISESDVCAGLDIHWQGDCTNIHDHSRCSATSGCSWSVQMTSFDSYVSWCQSDLRDAMMAPHASRYMSMIKPSENDLAALFFLYPVKQRQPSWGTKPIPMMSMTSLKLGFMLEECPSGGEENNANVDNLPRRQLAELVVQCHPWHPLTSSDEELELALGSQGTSSSPNWIWPVSRVLIALVLSCCMLKHFFANKAGNLVPNLWEESWEENVPREFFQQSHLLCNDDEPDIYTGAVVQLHGLTGKHINLNGARGKVLRRADTKDTRLAVSIQGDDCARAAKPENLIVLASKADVQAAVGLLNSIYGRISQCCTEHCMDIVEELCDNNLTCFEAWPSSVWPANHLMTCSDTVEEFCDNKSVASEASPCSGSPANHLMTRAANAAEAMRVSSRVPSFFPAEGASE